MKITINLNTKEAKHLASPHSFDDGCEEAHSVLVKVQKAIDSRKEDRKR